jgi:hypothetical protein
VKNARDHHETELSTSNNSLTIPNNKKIKSTNGATSLHKNLQSLTPIRLDSEPKYR